MPSEISRIYVVFKAFFGRLICIFGDNDTVSKKHTYTVSFWHSCRISKYSCCFYSLIYMENINNM